MDAGLWIQFLVDSRCYLSVFDVLRDGYGIRGSRSTTTTFARPLAGRNREPSLAFSPDGSKLASIGFDETVRVHALDLHDLIRIAKEKVTRTFTDVRCTRSSRRCVVRGLRTVATAGGEAHDLPATHRDECAIRTPGMVRQPLPAPVDSRGVEVEGCVRGTNVVVVDLIQPDDVVVDCGTKALDGDRHQVIVSPRRASVVTNG